MFMILLRFSDNKSQAAALMDGHNQWLKRGFDDGVFLMAGSLVSEGGGSVLAYGESMEAIKARVSEDPFVAENVVKAQIIEIEPKKVEDRLSFLLT